ncbi:Cyrochrome P450 monooxygenase [Colletotrichum fructicola Nara gc5]|uniref:Cyrochrome P450 monooxygenase n=1 Tax=Colletotrichum fructicola (strain Nara gc5) TaxID=1213859 RepID=A0A7J6IEH3_COLFN|nr:Cyrochrome P450 monooxygenase [Colletotrichum fructicola Nara gc5]
MEQTIVGPSAIAPQLDTTLSSLAGKDHIVTIVNAWPSVSQVLQSAIALWLLYGILLAIYRITCHPLAAIPGPKLAAATSWYEIWFDVVRWGRYTHEIKRMHEIYGPIIRISPDEVHCNDPSFIDVLYASGGKKRDKSGSFVAGFPSDLQLGGFGTLDHDHHRSRRSAASKHFSRAQIMKLERMIHAAAQKLCDKFLAHRGRGPFDVATAYSCYTADIISEYCFGEPFGFLRQPGWEPSFRAAVYAMFHLIHIMRHFPLVAWVVDRVPIRVVKLPSMVRQAKAEYDAGSQMNQNTVLFSLLSSDLPAKEKTEQRLSGEANVFLAAGTETTATALSLCTYHLLKNPNIRANAKAELMTVAKDPHVLPDWIVLERLPYLSAVIKETLRLMYGLSSRLPRIAPDEDVLYQGTWTPLGTTQAVAVRHVIPRGHAMGMSAYLVHTDERLYPEAATFIPERWLLKDGRKARHLERYLLTFSRGSRQCLGMQLAYCELYIAVAALTLRVMDDMRLYNTTDADVVYDFDLALAMPSRGSRGIRVDMC